MKYAFVGLYLQQQNGSGNDCLSFLTSASSAACRSAVEATYSMRRSLVHSCQPYDDERVDVMEKRRLKEGGGGGGERTGMH